MNLKEVCRACLGSEQPVRSILEAIVPNFHSPPNYVVELWNIFNKMLIPHDARFPDKICIECLDEIQRTYSFILKCEKSDEILRKTQNIPINLKCLKIDPADGPKNIKSQNDALLDISQIKTEHIESNPGCDEEDIGKWELQTVIPKNCESQEDPGPQHSPKIQGGDDKTKIDYFGYEDDGREDKVETEQDIKEEPEMDVSEEEHEFDEIDSENELSTEIWRCVACRYECRIKDNVIKHTIANHIEEQMCNICNKEFQCKPIEHCSLHLRVQNKKHHKCKVCSKLFRHKCHLKRHLITHTDERPFKCEICPRTYRYKISFMDHLKIHTGETPFKCDICLKSLQTKFSLSEHLKFHTGEKPFKCEICPKAFNRKNRLNEHLRSHTGEKPFKCEICSKTFRHTNNLTRHLVDHTGERPFKCEICRKDFGHKSYLTRHLVIHNEEKPFKCEICMKTFLFQSYLTDHLRCHTGERPFKCEICPKTFNRKILLVEHLCTHTGETLFKCEICPKGFNRKHLLTDHLRSHTGERPFKCDICPKAFQRKSDLKRHLRRHIEKNEINKKQPESILQPQEIINVDADSQGDQKLQVLSNVQRNLDYSNDDMDDELETWDIKTRQPEMRI